MDFWSNYYALHRDTPHAPMLEEAVEQMDNTGGPVLDIGAGNLRDTIFLLKKGFTVAAVDPDDASVRMAHDLQHPHLTIIQDMIGKVELPDNHFSLINAQHILFHFRPERFEFIIKKIKKTLRSDGIFCANLLGEKDGWNQEGNRKTFVTREKMEQVLEGFAIVKWEEKERMGSSASAQIEGMNKQKKWHTIDLVARKL